MGIIELMMTVEEAGNGIEVCVACCLVIVSISRYWRCEDLPGTRIVVIIDRLVDL